MMDDVKQGLEKDPNAQKPMLSGWVAAAGLVERWLARSERVDAVLEGLAPGLTPQEALAGAPASDQQRFLVPKILGEES